MAGTRDLPPEGNLSTLSTTLRNLKSSSLYIAVTSVKAYNTLESQDPFLFLFHLLIQPRRSVHPLSLVKSRLTMNRSSALSEATAI